MKKARLGSYRLKLLMLFSVTSLLITAFVTALVTIRANDNLREMQYSNLDLLTEQALYNFSNSAASTAREFTAALSSQDIPGRLWDIGADGRPATFQQQRDINTALSRMIISGSGFSSVCVSGLHGEFFHDTLADPDFVQEAEAILNDYNEKAYGNSAWIRTANGDVYLVRDVYHIMPLRFMGKAVTRIRANEMIELGRGDFTNNSTIAFFKDGGLIAIAGAAGKDVEAAAVKAIASDSLLVDGYLISRSKSPNWEAVGLFPESAITSRGSGLMQTALIVCMISITIGMLVIFLITGELSRSVQRLLGVMDRVSKGDMTARASEKGNGEIALLSEHFNEMLDSNEALVERIVHEEKQKEQAKYDALEYKYRSMHSQINPHFIYNAFEVVNAMAKLDGNREISDVITHISAFFRQNTVNMEKRFITVRREFASLREYAFIFRRIYGDELETPFSCNAQAESALIPTMILQPLMENALIHGIRSGRAVVAVGAAPVEGNRLRITIEDNGSGMDEETLRSLLEDEAPVEETDPRAARSAGIGIRNVRHRLKLIYGSDAEIRVESVVGSGTIVSVTLPILYEEKALDDTGI